MSSTGVLRRLSPASLARAAPIADGRFWLVQALVLAIAAGHNAIEALGVAHQLGMLYFVPTSLYFMPVIYAAMYFGLRGSLPTAILCTAISVPNWFLWHEGPERLGDMTQMTVVVFFGVFVGFRVNHERRLIASLESVTHALELSESRYRELFQSAGEAILVLDDANRVVDCNEAARALAGPSCCAKSNTPLDELFSGELSTHITALKVTDSERPPLVRLTALDGRDVWVEPVCASLGHTTQVLLRDVTEQHKRQANLEMYTAHIHRAQEEERRRIAQEIHDETVQSLILLCRELDDVEESVTGRGREHLAGVRRQTEEIIERLRGLIRGLRPPLLDDLGLVPAVQRLLDEVSSRSPIQTKLDVAGNGRQPPPSIELAFLRIAQEAINNAARHGTPTHVRVNITYEADGIAIEVADDGRGFEPIADAPDMVRTGHWGIAGMHERAREAGASLFIDSSPGAGTTVRATYGNGADQGGGVVGRYAPRPV
ncbi:MAG: ATP-binding protein [Chloroflexi bacterium]|nr:ATP-binding protein [Chloroflexota bacterium]